VVTEDELSNTAKLSVFKSVFDPILTCSYEYWVKISQLYNRAVADPGGQFGATVSPNVCGAHLNGAFKP